MRGQAERENGNKLEWQVVESDTTSQCWGGWENGLEVPMKSKKMPTLTYDRFLHDRNSLGTMSTTRAFAYASGLSPKSWLFYREKKKKKNL